jgi:hypothetical protein
LKICFCVFEENYGRDSHNRKYLKGKNPDVTDVSIKEFPQTLWYVTLVVCRSGTDVVCPLKNLLAS